MATAYAVQQDGTVGTTAAELRKMLSYKWQSTGIVGGLKVTGRSNLAYNVAAGMAICSKGSSDGCTEAYYPGGQTPAVDANSGSNPRLDAVWITSHDVTQGDGDNLVTVGVTQGTPAATPAAPAIPTYATLLALMLVPAGATKTSSASVSALGQAAAPYGSSLGILVDALDSTSTDAQLPTDYRTYCSGTFTVPTDRYVDIKRIFTLASKVAADSSAYTRVMLDGVQISQGEVRAYGSPALATSQYFENTVRVSAGTHAIQAQMKQGVNSTRKYYSAGGWAGQTLQVVDAGIAV